MAETKKSLQRCEACGYTETDAQIQGDHRLCRNAGNAPWEKRKKKSEQPVDQSSPSPTDRLEVGQRERIEKIRSWQDSRKGFNYHADIEYLLDLVDVLAVESVASASIPQREGICGDCHQEYVTPWFAPNDLWNRVVPDRVAMLCPNCFLTRAKIAGFDSSWELREEDTTLPDEIVQYLAVVHDEPSIRFALKELLAQRWKGLSDFAETAIPQPTQNMATDNLAQNEIHRLAQPGPNTIRTPDGSLAVLGIAGGQIEKCPDCGSSKKSDRGIDLQSHVACENPWHSSVTSSGSDQNGMVSEDPSQHASALPDSSSVVPSSVPQQEIRPCPFCGAAWPINLFIQSNQETPNEQQFYIFCGSCGCNGGWAKQEAGAIRMWNLRIAVKDGK
jgi:hypothetical protein